MHAHTYNIHIYFIYIYTCVYSLAGVIMSDFIFFFRLKPFFPQIFNSILLL